MIYILHYVAFDSATQTLRYEPQNFGQISIFRHIWSYFQRNHLSIKNYSNNYYSQWKLTKKIAWKTQISRKFNNCALNLMTCVWMMDRNILVILLLKFSTISLICVYLIKLANSAILKINFALGWAAFRPFFSVCAHFDWLYQAFGCNGVL